MKNIFRRFILLFCSCMLMSVAYAQSGKAQLDDVLNAIKGNHLQDVGKYLDNVVPITINNSQSNYSHNQAQLILNDFFSKNPPRDFVVLNTGAPSPAAKFAIADFNTPNGKYNIYIMMKQKDNTFVIKEIKLNKE